MSIHTYVCRSKGGGRIVETTEADNPLTLLFSSVPTDSKAVKISTASDFSHWIHLRAFSYTWQCQVLWVKLQIYKKHGTIFKIKILLLFLIDKKSYHWSPLKS